jgi:uncharacterized membrane protein
MAFDLNNLRIGLVLSMLTLIFGISMGVLFGANEDGVKQYITDGIATHQSLHDSKSESKIWRYAQRSHFHATGVGGFALVLVLITGLTTLSRNMKLVASTLIGIGSFYSMAWFSMFLLSPSMGRDAAHHALITEVITYATVCCLSVGILMLMAGLVINFNRAETGQMLNPGSG